MVIRITIIIAHTPHRHAKQHTPLYCRGSWICVSDESEVVAIHPVVATINIPTTTDGPADVENVTFFIRLAPALTSAREPF